MKERKYIFKLDNVKPAKLSKPEIIKCLKEFSLLNNHQQFTMREFDKWEQKPISAGSISKIFGDWTSAMRQAGLKSTVNRKKDTVEMVEIFKDAWEHFDAIPSGKQLDMYLKNIAAPYTYRVYCHTFGNIRSLGKRIIDHQEGKISDSELYSKYVAKNIREPISPKMRFEVLKRDNNQCVKCGASPKKDKNVTLEIDHIIPVAKGGKNDLLNFQTLCHRCNIGKSDRHD
jgi:5-methylcytosine-specific restriction protein A